MCKLFISSEASVRKERALFFYGTDFWPELWTIVGGSAALVVLLSLVIAAIPLSRQGHPRVPARTAVASRRRRRELSHI
jgi:hypothetical protein